MSASSVHKRVSEREEVFNNVNSKGIKPFLDFIESGERQFFRAKEFMPLYDMIFKVCIEPTKQDDGRDNTEFMYEKYTWTISNYVLDTVKPKLEAALRQYDTALLKEWTKCYENHKSVVAGLSKLFMYLDRYYTPNGDNVLPLKEQGFKIYRDYIFNEFVNQVRTAILNAIEKERNNEEQDRHLLEESIKVFQDIDSGKNLYHDSFQIPLIESSGVYYQRKSREWLDQDSCTVYLEKVEKILQQERQRVDAYLHSSTKEPLLKRCYIELLQVHQSELLHKKTGFHHLLHVLARDDLSRLYRLYKLQEPDLEPIAEMFQEHLSKSGSELVDQAQNNAQAAGDNKENKEENKEAPAAQQDANHALVRNLIDLHATYNEIVTVCFEKTQVMQKALKKAFEQFINKDNRVAKLLAKFVNDVLKKGSKVNVKDIDSTLDNIVFLYGYIQDKDVFEVDYQVYLANRLLMGLCESEHSEKSMIAKLKAECGYQWTNKLEGMFKDVQLSKDVMQNFKSAFDTENTIDMQLEVNVCTTGYWPSTKFVPCIMPREVIKACEKYKRFYLDQHSGHKLDWRFDQGQAEITVKFSTDSIKSLVVSTYQMMIMLVFNSFEIVSFKQILDTTGIPKNEIAHHLFSLCHPKVNILLKKPNIKKLEDNHLFQINSQYKNPLKRVHVMLMRPVETEENNEEENKTIELQRRHQMDASIVRIMKTRKTLRHNMLVNEVISQLSARFKPKPNDIKKRIEALIEQDYIVRDPNDRGTYNYIA